MTNALSAFGTLLKIGDGGGTEVFTAIAEVTKLSGPSLSLDTIDATHDASPGGFKECVAGLLDAGEVKFDVNYKPTETTHNATAGLLRDMVNKTKRNFKLVFPDSGSTTWSFSAFVTKFEPDAPVDGKLGASITLKITGQPTLA